MTTEEIIQVYGMTREEKSIWLDKEIKKSIATKKRNKLILLIIVPLLIGLAIVLMKHQNII